MGSLLVSNSHALYILGVDRTTWSDDHGQCVIVQDVVGKDDANSSPCKSKLSAKSLLEQWTDHFDVGIDMDTQ